MLLARDLLCCLLGLWASEDLPGTGGSPSMMFTYRAVDNRFQFNGGIEAASDLLLRANW